jgi:hypothetical protein
MHEQIPPLGFESSQLRQPWLAMEASGLRLAVSGDIIHK